MIFPHFLIFIGVVMQVIKGFSIDFLIIVINLDFDGFPLKE